MREWQSIAVQPTMVTGLVASGKQLHGYSSNTLSPLSDYRSINKGLLVCHQRNDTRLIKMNILTTQSLHAMY